MAASWPFSFCLSIVAEGLVSRGELMGVLSSSVFSFSSTCTERYWQSLAENNSNSKRVALLTCALYAACSVSMSRRAAVRASGVLSQMVLPATCSSDSMPSALQSSACSL